MSDVSTCRDCGAPIRLKSEKALGREWQNVWMSADETWICPQTGNEHRPGEPSRPVKVIVRHGDTEVAIDLSLAEFGNFVVRPINETVYGGEPAWDLADSDSGRLDALTTWAQGLYGVTR